MMNTILFFSYFEFISSEDIFLRVDCDVVPVAAVYCDTKEIYVYDHKLAFLVNCN